jgi:hypothetical protein
MSRFWPFRRRRAAPSYVLDDATLERVIRAGVSIPLEVFLAQPPEVQEAIALRRDAWVEEVALVAGYAAMDPERTRLALEAEDGSEEAAADLEALNAASLAAVLARRGAAGASPASEAPAPATMGGRGKRASRRAAAALAAGPRRTPWGGEEVRS